MTRTSTTLETTTKPITMNKVFKYEGTYKSKTGRMLLFVFLTLEKQSKLKGQSILIPQCVEFCIKYKTKVTSYS